MPFGTVSSTKANNNAAKPPVSNSGLQVRVEFDRLGQNYAGCDSKNTPQQFHFDTPKLEMPTKYAAGKV